MTADACTSPAGVLHATYLACKERPHDAHVPRAAAAAIDQNAKQDASGALWMTKRVSRWIQWSTTNWRWHRMDDHRSPSQSSRLNFKVATDAIVVGRRQEARSLVVELTAVNA